MNFKDFLLNENNISNKVDKFIENKKKLKQYVSVTRYVNEYHVKYIKDGVEKVKVFKLGV